MKLHELQHGQHVSYRTGRAGETAVDWNGWTIGTLHVQTRPCDLPKHLRHHTRFWQKGMPTVIAIQGINWAEYRPDDYNPEFNTFDCEDYYLEIEGMEG